jgi:peptidoglycan/LPS O-acetylase OafA/YrhL
MVEHGAISIAMPLTAWVLETSLWGNLSAFWGAVPILIALWVFLLVERRDWILNNPVASTFGVLSYSLYLWQQPFAAERRYPAMLALLLIAACATGSYLLIEKPMLRMGASIESRRKRTETPSATLVPTD